MKVVIIVFIFFSYTNEASLVKFDMTFIGRISKSQVSAGGNDWHQKINWGVENSFCYKIIIYFYI